MTLNFLARTLRASFLTVVFWIFVERVASVFSKAAAEVSSWFQGLANQMCLGTASGATHAPGPKRNHSGLEDWEGLRSARG